MKYLMHPLAAGPVQEGAGVGGGREEREGRRERERERGILFLHLMGLFP